MNLPTIIILAVVVIAVAAIVWRAVYNKKHHRSSCGCGCEGCAGSEFCHPGEVKSK